MAAPRLVVLTGNKAYTLQKPALLRYPDSLFASILVVHSHDEQQQQQESVAHGCAAAVAAATKDSNENTVRLDMDKLSSNPVSMWPECMQHITALYSTGTLELETWKALLAQHDDDPEALLEKLSGVFSYLNLPGPAAFLPPINNIQVDQARMLTLHYICSAKQQVSQVVAQMLQYKPHAQLGRPAGLIICAVTATTAESQLPVLETYVMAQPPRDLVKQCRARHYNDTGAYFPPCDAIHRVSVSTGVPHLVRLPETGLDAPSIPVQDVKAGSTTYVEHADGIYGKYLKAALLAECSSIGITCSAFTCVLSCYPVALPVWVLMW